MSLHISLPTKYWAIVTSLVEVHSGNVYVMIPMTAGPDVSRIWKLVMGLLVAGTARRRRGDRNLDG